ncbi:hypothetical protein SLS62_008524 [Diatrype stigma]|uniref:RRM domain-containing protein n=1 Tax=Diatrype stigma TaxID=117547 RepID=A0AAN9URF1_9PEZI
MDTTSSSTKSTASSVVSVKDERPKYRPSMMVLQRRGLITRNAGGKKGSRPADSNQGVMEGTETSDGKVGDEQARKRLGMSLAYRGDPTLKANQSADIDDSKNASLFIQNLPPTCSYHEFLGSIRSIGKVQSTHITPPGDTHNTSCAKITLYTRAAAEKLYKKIQAGEIIIQGYRLRCVWNRIKVAGLGDKWHSRVLIVVGREEELSRQLLDRVLDENLVYDIDEIIDHGKVDGLVQLEYRFGSYSCQAQFAMKAIQAHFDGRSVLAEFGYFDPCEFSF